MIEIQVPDAAGTCIRLDLLVWRSTTRTGSEGCGASGNQRCGNTSVNSDRNAIGAIGLRGCISDNTKNKSLYISSTNLYNMLEATLSSSGCSNGGSCCSPSQTEPRPKEITCIVARNGYSGSIGANGNMWVNCSGSECVTDSDDSAVVALIATDLSCSSYSTCLTTSYP